MKTVRLTESDLVRIVRRVISEQPKKTTPGNKPTTKDLHGIPPKIKLLYQDGTLSHFFNVENVYMNIESVELEGSVPMFGDPDPTKMGAPWKYMYSCRDGKVTDKNFKSQEPLRFSPQVEEKLRAFCNTYVKSGSGDFSSYV